MNCKTNSDAKIAYAHTITSSFSSGNIGNNSWTLQDPKEALSKNDVATFFQVYVIYLLLGKAFFVTKMGYMGTSLEAIQVGDTIVVFAGMNLPVVVRKEGDFYRLIGPTYAHGIMDGEAWEERSTLAEEFTLI
jgi:hypothetical protein